MNTVKLLIPAVLILLLTACGDDAPDSITYDYHAHINSPTASVLKLGETLDISVDFESHTGEKVHHVNVKVTNLEDPTLVLFDAPGEAHVHSDGSYLYAGSLEITEKNNFTAHANYVLTATVWGHEAGEQVASESIQFHVHPE